MLAARPHDESSAHGGPRRRERRIAARGRVAALLGALHCAAISLVALVVFAVAASSGRGSATLVAAAFGVAAAESATAERVVRPSESLPHWQEAAARTLFDLEALESDVDDEDGQWDMPLLAALSFEQLLASPEAGRARWGELSVGASPYEAGVGLPRGPPGRIGA